jgi:hypothetical protein
MNLSSPPSTPGIVRILSISTEETPTPRYRARDQPTHGRPLRLWHVIAVEYESRPEYIDELTFDYWVMVGEGRGAAGEQVLSKRTAYLDVERGIHRGVVYLHPNTLARFGPARRIAVSVSLAGREVAYATLRGGQDRAWLTPTDYSRLHSRRDTPFRLIDCDSFPFEKPGSITTDRAPAPAKPALDDTRPEPAEPNQQTTGGRVIGHLKTMDKLITMQSGPDGPLYTVKSKGGRVVAADLSAAELSARFPELSEVVERGIADWAGIDRTYKKVESALGVMPMETHETRTIVVEESR